MNPVNSVTVDKYQDAVRLFNEGNLIQAEILLSSMLAENKDDYDVLNFLGVIKLNKEKYSEAEVFFERVVSLCSLHKEAYYNLGFCYQNKKEYNQALECYQKVLNTGYSHFDSLINSGVIYLTLKEFDKAISFFNYCRSLQPENPQIYNNLGNVNLSLNNPEAALLYYDIALKLDNGNPVYYYNSGIAHLKSRNDELAIEYFEKTLSLNPEHSEALKSLAIVYSKTGQHSKAEECLTRLNNGNFSKALNANNQGVAMLQKHELSKAIDCFDIALKYEPERPEIHYNKSHALLLAGNYEEGLKEYQWRLKRDDFPGKVLSKPLSFDADICGKRILVIDEQGLGDSIQFVRFIPILKKLGAYTIFECDNRLLPLYDGMNGIDELIPRERKNQEIVYDYDVHLLSLPAFMKTTLRSIPADFPYIKAESNYIKKWKKIIGDSASYKIGIAWAGNPKHTGDKKRSVSLTSFIPILDIKGVEYFVLQKGPALKQVENISYKLNIVDQHNENLLDAAAAIHCLDLVITVDTSIAHLSGAMGKKTWLLLPYTPDWRWMLNRADTPWYPAIEIFRQEKPDDWESLFKVVKTELETLKNKNKNAGELQTNYQNSNKSIEPIYFGLSNGENYGWGICGKYIKKELSKKTKVIDLNENKELMLKGKLNGKIFHALTGLSLKPALDIYGDFNAGYTFFENELNEKSVENSKNLDIILTGSVWCKQKLKEKGINNADVLIQGIDPELFYPGEANKNENLFVIFSGGKFEFRKSQDLVLKAIKIIQEKYTDIILINAWYNLWPPVLLTMKNSAHINFELKGDSWDKFMNHIYEINNLDSKRIITLPLVPNKKLREIYLKSDVGLFPNRCEGGTNLVLMEYMACGRPAISSYNTGHKDILTEQNSIFLKEGRDVKLYSADKILEAEWSEPLVDEIVEKIEYAYHNREVIKKRGILAAQDMKKLTWENTAKNLLKYLG